jgi:hypothetical protein
MTTAPRIRPARLARRRVGRVLLCIYLLLLGAPVLDARADHAVTPHQATACAAVADAVGIACAPHAGETLPAAPLTPDAVDCAFCALLAGSDPAAEPSPSPVRPATVAVPLPAATPVDPTPRAEFRPFAPRDPPVL